MATYLLLFSIYCLLTVINAQWGPYTTSVLNYDYGLIAVYHGDDLLRGVDVSYRGYLRITADHFAGYQYVRVTGTWYPNVVDDHFYYWKVSPDLKISIGDVYRSMLTALLYLSTQP